MREVLDPIDPSHFRKPFKKLFSLVQRNGLLKAFEFQCDGLRDWYLLSIDGTGLFYSGECRCEECCIKNKGKPNESYYHNLLGGCIVHPDQKTVIPLAPEAIVRQGGSTKNDCEKNAIKRFLAHTKREHPHLKFVILLDGLHADNPTIELIKSYGWHYIIVAKDGNHVPLIERPKPPRRINIYEKLTFQSGAFRYDVSKNINPVIPSPVGEVTRKATNALCDEGKLNYHDSVDEDGTKHWYRFANSVPLNAADLPEIVNVLDYVQTDKEGKRHTWCWVRDIKLTEDTVEDVMRGGRCRWHIENQTFNTLKNQGYHLEHNYGHGKFHLATNLAYLTFLAFLADQIQEMASPEFKKALKERSKGVRTYLWKLKTRIFLSWFIDDWDELFDAITKGMKPSKIQINSS